MAENEGGVLGNVDIENPVIKQAREYDAYCVENIPRTETDSVIDTAIRELRNNTQGILDLLKKTIPDNTKIKFKVPHVVETEFKPEEYKDYQFAGQLLLTLERETNEALSDEMGLELINLYRTPYTELLFQYIFLTAVTLHKYRQLALRILPAAVDKRVKRSQLVRIQSLAAGGLVVSPSKDERTISNVIPDAVIDILNMKLAMNPDLCNEYNLLVISKQAERPAHFPVVRGLIGDVDIPDAIQAKYREAVDTMQARFIKKHGLDKPPQKCVFTKAQVEGLGGGKKPVTVTKAPEEPPSIEEAVRRATNHKLFNILIDSGSAVCQSAISVSSSAFSKLVSLAGFEQPAPSGEDFAFLRSELPARPILSHALGSATAFPSRPRGEKPGSKPLPSPLPTAAEPRGRQTLGESGVRERPPSRSRGPPERQGSGSRPVSGSRPGQGGGYRGKVTRRKNKKTHNRSKKINNKRSTRRRKH